MQAGFRISRDVSQHFRPPVKEQAPHSKENDERHNIFPGAPCLICEKSTGTSTETSTKIANFLLQVFHGTHSGTNTLPELRFIPNE
jgi:hypothetical protein